MLVCPRTCATVWALLTTGCSIRQAADDFFAAHDDQLAADSDSDPPETSSSGAPHETTTTTAPEPSSTTDLDTTTGQGDPPTDLTTTTTTTTTDTTYPAPAVCGDGEVSGDEECDDPADLAETACMLTTCVRPRLAFLTSERFHGDELHGLAGADNRCRVAALAGGLPEPENYRAILSDSTTSAADRLHHARGPYRLVNGLQVARDWHALMNEPLDNPLATTELGTKGYPAAWTGTEPGGAAVPGSEHCDDWTSKSLSKYGSYGTSTAIDGEWLKVADPLVNPSTCVDKLPIYCLEQQ